MSGYISMLNDLGITQEQLDIITNYGNVLEFETDTYYKDKSIINGIGVFALKKLKKGDIVGIGSIDNKYKTILGRYTNHSNDNNAMFYYLENNDIIMIAEKEIKAKEEILINYRDHVINRNTFKSNEKYL
tara:strand:- start:417 stop:806 length:390 start_codon:yes stop_codon:yes gene_type:complete